MPSHVEAISESMKRLLWNSILQELLTVWLRTIPFFGWPVVKDVVIWFVETQLAEPLFIILSRWGVFTSIDWQNSAIYAEYEKEAKLLITHPDEWTKEDRRRFKDAARRLIRLTLK